ncbi:MAG TPA: TolC family protein [Atribacterota bacterium]|nr:TolC family protein [Atribacterota bacterium]
MKSLNLREKMYKIIFILLTGLFLILNFQILKAKEISVEEALQWGVLHNLDLQSIRYSIEDIKRNLEIVEAGKSFQIDLSITPIWRFGEKDNPYLVEIGENRVAPDTKLNLSAKKMLTPNLSMSGEVSWQSENSTEHFIEAIAEEVKANIKLEQKLYPRSWTEQERQTYSLENNLQMKLEELKWKEIEKQIEFIQKYLNIIRLQEQLEIASERLRLAEEALERVRAQIKLGEGGFQQEAEAIISLGETQNKHWSTEQDLNMAKRQWYLLLNLPEEATVDFATEALFIDSLFQQMENLPIFSQSRDIFINQALQENYQFKNSVIEKDELLKELQWTKDAGKPVVNLSGGHTYPDSDWFVMVDFRINLADGGIQELKVKQKEENVKRKEVNLVYLMEMLRLEAEQLLDKDEYNQLILQTLSKSLEKEQEKEKIIEQQYHQGAISLAQRDNNLILLKEKELGLKQASDQWLVDRLKLAHLIGLLPKGV